MLIVGNSCLLVSWWLRCSFMFLVFLNFLKMILFIFELVLISVVVRIVSELLFLMLCVVLKNCLGG